METNDFRVIRAREFLARARQCSVAGLSASELTREDAELRRLLGWVIDVVDDYADTDLDLDVSQVVLWGGLYLKPADVLSLCPGCLSRAPHFGEGHPPADWPPPPISDSAEAYATAQASGQGVVAGARRAQAPVPFRPVGPLKGTGATAEQFAVAPGHRGCSSPGR